MNTTIRCTAAAVLLGAAAAAQATPSMQADITMDWTSFTVSPLAGDDGITPTLSWYGQTSTVHAYDPQAVSVADWTTPLTATATGVGSSALATVDATRLYGTAQDTDPGSSGASLWSLRQGQFTVAGSGTVQMSVNYSWHIDSAPPANAPLWSSFAYALASLEAWTRYDPRHFENRGDRDDLDIQVFAPDAGQFSGTGTLFLEMPVLDGDLFYFTAATSPVANLGASLVPWPPSAATFLCGLGAILIARRRHPARAAGADRAGLAR
jgi:hypothetical protein